jgi:hypothetical protein
MFFGPSCKNPTQKRKKENQTIKVIIKLLQILVCTLLYYVGKFSISLEIDIPYHGFTMKINSKLVISAVFIHHDFINDDELIKFYIFTN